MRVPFCKVNCNGNELKYIREVIESGWLTTAGKAFELEKKFAARVGGRYACAVNSGTAALHLALEALGVKKGSRVFVPTMTFTASAEVIRYLRGDPVFLDVEYCSNLITPKILEKAIACNPDVKTMVVVHYGGQAAEMIREDKRGILDICKTHNIRIIEDAAHAFPTRHRGKLVGTFGDVTCFSFYANKTMTTGEGGMLVTDSSDIASRARTMRLHGIDRDIWNRFTAKKPSWEYDVVAPGYKYNMSDINAAIGLAQLERADKMRIERQHCAEFYFRELADMDCMDLPLVHGLMEEHSWHLFPIVLNSNAPVSRNECIELLASEGIGTSVHYKPLHRMTYYKKKYNLSARDFPNAEKTWQGCISLPIFPGLRDAELDFICKTLKKILRK